MSAVPFSLWVPQLQEICKTWNLDLHNAKDFRVAREILHHGIELN
jgi:hypothetical protein